MCMRTLTNSLQICEDHTCIHGYTWIQNNVTCRTIHPWTCVSMRGASLKDKIDYKTIWRKLKRQLWVNNHLYCNLLILKKFQGTHFCVINKLEEIPKVAWVDGRPKVIALGLYILIPLSRKGILKMKRIDVLMLMLFINKRHFFYSCNASTFSGDFVHLLYSWCWYCTWFLLCIVISLYKFENKLILNIGNKTS